ncbi:MAG: Anti-sigma factor antagonist [Actinomycetia bacterium]|nr:Anti-sigma factor antagonist [Actinomycetes bacterium]
MPTGRTDAALGTISADPALTLHTETGEAGTVLHVAGELDIITTGQLECHAGRLLAARPSATLVLDLSALRFAAVDGVRTLLRIRDVASANGGRLVLRDPSPRVVRVLALTQALSCFDLESRVNEVAGAESRGPAGEQGSG